MTKVACAFKKNKNKLQPIDFQYDNYKFKSNKKSEVQLTYISSRIRTRLLLFPIYHVVYHEL